MFNCSSCNHNTAAHAVLHKFRCCVGAHSHKNCASLVLLVIDFSRTSPDRPWNDLVHTRPTPQTKTRASECPVLSTNTNRVLSPLWGCIRTFANLPRAYLSAICVFSRKQLLPVWWPPLVEERARNVGEEPGEFCRNPCCDAVMEKFCARRTRFFIYLRVINCTKLTHGDDKRFSANQWLSRLRKRTLQVEHVWQLFNPRWQTTVFSKCQPARNGRGKTDAFPKRNNNAEKTKDVEIVLFSFWLTMRFILLTSFHNKNDTDEVISRETQKYPIKWMINLTTLE